MQISDSVSNKHLGFCMPNNAGDTDGISWPYNTLRQGFTQFYEMIQHDEVPTLIPVVLYQALSHWNKSFVG